MAECVRWRWHADAVQERNSDAFAADRSPEPRQMLLLHNVLRKEFGPGPAPGAVRVRARCLFRDETLCPPRPVHVAGYDPPTFPHAPARGATN